MTKTVTMQRIDNELILRLPEGVSAKDFEDWLNNTPDKPQLKFVELPERWTSVEPTSWDTLEELKYG